VLPGALDGGLCRSDREVQPMGLRDQQGPARTLYRVDAVGQFLNDGVIVCGNK
jgi:hypothetical protein